MLGPIGSSLMSILRVLTPDEIERYTHVVHEERPVESVVAVGAEGLSFDAHNGPRLEEQSKKKQDKEENKAEIIPLHGRDRDPYRGGEGREELSHQHEDKEYQSDQEDNHASDRKMPQHSHNEESANELEALGIFSESRIREFEKKRIEKEKSTQESTTMFILNQKTKLAKSQGRLKGQQAISIYRKSANNEHLISKDVDLDLSDDDNASSSSASAGILINKKQA